MTALVGPDGMTPDWRAAATAITVEEHRVALSRRQRVAELRLKQLACPLRQARRPKHEARPAVALRRDLALEKEHMASVKRGVSSWFRRLLLRAALAVIVLTVVPVVLLRWIPPPTSAVMVEKWIGAMGQSKPGRSIRYRWTRWNAISAPMGLAVVAAEDQKFPQHWGFDFYSIVDAVEEQGAKGRLRGASTITQQVARNLFLWQGRSYVRKTLEAYFTVLLEVFWPKRRILEVYLNIAEFGEGIYGVGTAAQTFFSKRPIEIHTSEAALLAAVLPNPVRFHVRNPSAYVRQRAGWIEQQMTQLGGPAYLGQL